MRIANSRIDRCSTFSRRASAVIVAATLTLLQGCAVNAPACEGRFEPINLPAPVSRVREVEDKPASSDSDTAHE
jgi:hypothetical protein